MRRAEAEAIEFAYTATAILVQLGQEPASLDTLSTAELVCALREYARSAGGEHLPLLVYGTSTRLHPCQVLGF